MEKINLHVSKEFILEEKLYENDIAKSRVEAVKDVLLERHIILKTLAYENNQQKNIIMQEIRNQVLLEKYTEYIPHIYNVYDDKNKREIVIEMQKIEGKSLRQLIEESRNKQKNNDWYRITYELYLRIRETMANIHKAQGFVHKDLKPENIIINRNRRPEAVYIIDFGISGPGMNKGVGTERYMAPEQRGGMNKFQVRQWTDVFALGQIAIEMFTGNTLAYGKDLIADPMGNDWLKKPDLSSLGGTRYPQLGKVIERAVSMDPAVRFINAEKLRSALIVNKQQRKGDGQWKTKK